MCALAPAPPQAIGEAELLSLLPKVDNLPSGFAPLLNVLLVDDSMTVRTLVAAIVRGLVWRIAFQRRPNGVASTHTAVVVVLSPHATGRSQSRM